MAQLLESLISQLNLKLDLEKFLEKTQLNKNLKRETDFILSTCPFHNKTENLFLTLNTKSRTYKCSQNGCEGEQGGKLVDLYSKINHLSIDDAVIKIFEEIGVENNEENQPLIRNLYLNIAEKLELEGLNESAINTLLKAFQLFPKNLIILSRLANLHTKEKNIDKACKYLIQVAETVKEMRNYSSAHSTLRRIFSLDPYNEKALKLKKEIIYQEWEDYLNDKITKEEKDTFEKKISFRDTPLETRAKIALLLFKFKRFDIIREITVDLNEELSLGKPENKIEYIQLIENSLTDAQGIEDIYAYLGEQFSELKDNKKTVYYYNLAKEAAIAGKTSIPLSEIESKLDILEENLFKNDFLAAQKLQNESKFEQASEIYKKIIDMGLKKIEVYEQYINCEYRLGREESAVKICIDLSDYFYRRDNHIGALITLFRGLNFIPDHPLLIDKTCELYNSLGYKELADEIKTEVEKRKNKKPSQVFMEKPTFKSLEKSLPEKEKILTASKPIHPSSDEELDLDIPHSSKETTAKSKPSISIAAKKSDTPLPFKSTDEIPIEIPISLRLSGSGINTDLASIIEGTTISLGLNSCRINLGSGSILGLPPASINYTLTNSNIIMFISIPDKVEPIRLFGKIFKVQNINVGNKIDKIINVELLQEDYADRKEFLDFIDKYRRGLVDFRRDKEITPPPMKAKTSKPTTFPQQTYKRTYQTDFSKVQSPNYSSPSYQTSKAPSPQQRKISKEINITVKFIGYRSTDSKPLSPIPAKISNIENKIIEVDYGQLEIPGVRQASVNFFLRTNKQVLIEFEDPRNKRKLSFSGETTDTKTRRTGRNILISAFVEIKDMKDPAVQNLMNLLV